MKEYPDQPSLPSDIDEKADIDENDLGRFISDYIKEDLPDCPTNEWFLGSVYFANMVDSIVRGIIGNCN